MVLVSEFLDDFWARSSVCFLFALLRSTRIFKRRNWIILDVGCFIWSDIFLLSKLLFCQIHHKEHFASSLLDCGFALCFDGLSSWTLDFDLGANHARSDLWSASQCENQNDTNLVQRTAASQGAGTLYHRILRHWGYGRWLVCGLGMGILSAPSCVWSSRREQSLGLLVHEKNYSRWFIKESASNEPCKQTSKQAKKQD